MKRWIGIIALTLCVVIGLPAEEKAVPIIRAWQLDQWSGVADTLATIDSSYMHFPMRDKLNDYSISNISNSNLISPILSRIYFDRTKTVDFIFADAYTPYIITPQQVKYYHTTTPYSTIAYKKGLEAVLDKYLGGHYYIEYEW